MENRGGATAIGTAQVKTSTSLGGTDAQHGPQPEADEVQSDSGTSKLFSFVTVKKSQTGGRATV